jgi:putative ABC transport system permease protein
MVKLKKTMRTSNLLRVSTAAIARNKTRSLLTSLGIIIGVASVILLVSIGSGIQTYVTQAFEDLGTNLLYIMPGKFQIRDSREGGAPGVATNKLTIKLADKIERSSRYVNAVLPIMSTNNTLKYRANTHDTFVIGTYEQYSEIRNSPLSVGRFFSKSEVRRFSKVAVIGTTVAEELFGDTYPINKEILVGDKRYKVIGVLESKGSGLGNDQDNQIIVPITTLQRQTNADKLTYIYVQIENTDNTDKATKEIEAILLDEGLSIDEFSVLNSEELLSTVSGILSAITLGLGGIAAISLIVGGIGIMNIMLVSVTERTREIGLRKAVGAHPRDILIQFLLEAIILSLIGGAIGITIGALGSLALNQFFQTTITPWSIIIAFIFSTIVGIVFGVWPARKASKLSPIDALRYE